jgi:hypothetical protein
MRRNEKVTVRQKQKKTLVHPAGTALAIPVGFVREYSLCDSRFFTVHLATLVFRLDSERFMKSFAHAHKANDYMGAMRKI